MLRFPVEDTRQYQGKILFQKFETEPPSLTDQEGLDNIGHLKNKIKTFILDETDIISAPFVYTLPNQLIAYHIALLKGTDVDQPRNLAKSVTVE